MWNISKVHWLWRGRKSHLGCLICWEGGWKGMGTQKWPSLSLKVAAGQGPQYLYLHVMLNGSSSAVSRGLTESLSEVCRSGSGLNWFDCEEVAQQKCTLSWNRAIFNIPTHCVPLPKTNKKWIYDFFIKTNPPFVATGKRKINVALFLFNNNAKVLHVNLAYKMSHLKSIVKLHYYYRSADYVPWTIAALWLIDSILVS